MIYRFIRDHRRQFPVRTMCRVLGVSRSGYYAWQKRPTSQRERANPGAAAGLRSQFIKEIQATYTASRATYGSPRITEELQGQGITCCRCHLAGYTHLFAAKGAGRSRYREPPVCGIGYHLFAA